MRLTRSLLFLATCSLWASVNAQFTEIGTNNRGLNVLTTLHSGLKLVEPRTATQPFDIFNLDMSLYTTITPPVLGAPYVFISMSNITDALFDNDPSTVEFMITFEDTTGGMFGPHPVGFAIYRQDGTELLRRLPGGLWALFNSPQGTLMVYSDTATTPVHVVLLPGTLPCNDCQGNPLMVQESDRSTFTSGDIEVFPNPSNDAAQVDYTLPPGITHAELVLHAMNGQEVKRLPLGHTTGRLSLTTALLPAGTYTYHLTAEGNRLGGDRLVVVH